MAQGAGVHAASVIRRPGGAPKDEKRSGRSFEACIDGTLDQVELEFEDNAAVCVVLASDGYPEHYEKGYPISGLERFKDADGYFVFHAGTN